MNPAVYIETTVVSYLTARPRGNALRTEHQRLTRLWWDTERQRFDLYTSDLVLLEASAGDPIAAEERLAVLRALPLLAAVPESDNLAEMLVQSSAIPPQAARDALHVAIAAVNGMDYLLTWNCRHLANAFLRARIEQTCTAAGFTPPVICTPEQLFPSAL